jgi:two-component system OmpR family sensor kinase
MILRVFVVIWGALVLTLLLFGLVVAGLDPTPPNGALVEAEVKVIQRQLAFLAARDGVPAALELWDKVSQAHPGIAVTSVCAAGNPLPQGQDCIMVRSTLQHNRFLEGLKILTLPLLVGVAVSAAASALLSRHLTRPIRTVNEALQRLASGDLATRVGAMLRHSSGELVRLGDAFDHAADRLQTLSEGQRRLFNDLSHEIRSPLARLRAAVGLLEVSPERLQDMLRQIETDIVRLDQLLRDILTLARYDSVEARPAFTRLDLIDILEPILSDANFEGQARGIMVNYVGPARLDLSGSHELLHRAIENVIRNALAYSPDGGQVTVRASKTAQALTISILDHGPGVPEAERLRLLEPFVRLPNTAGRSGSGLGLAIAARAIAAHGGSVELTENDPQGLSVRFVLPYAQWAVALRKSSEDRMRPAP